jgi:phosphoribosylamine--glycine ligase
MKVLIVGSGGREHALAWRLRQSPRLSQLWVAGGNAGTASIATNLPVNPEDVAAVASAAQSIGADLVVVGPEAPLALGLVDRLADLGIPAFGPSQAAAQIEASKSFALDLMREAGVPCPWFRVFRQQSEALSFVSRHRGPLVVKADGLAAGKGVSLCATQEEAAAAVRACMSQGIFGPAGATVVVEELLEGQEVSVFAFSDGERLSPLAAACDYKRLQDGDRGPNTGGMGSYAPPPFWDSTLADDICGAIMRPVIETLAARGIPYRGVLYAGVMLTRQGPKVLEFNCRLGDPEAQVILPLLDSDPLDVMLACVQGRLEQAPVRWRSQPHVGVVITSGGYPARYESGLEITGLEQSEPHSLVFHAGTRLTTEGGRTRVVTNGGRVLTVVGWGSSLEEARTAAYRRAQGIHFSGAYYRRDIAAAGVVNREPTWAPGPTAPAG